MYVPYTGTQWDCKGSPFAGYLYMNRRQSKAATTKRVKPTGVNLLFSPTSYGPNYQSIRSDALSSKPFEALCDNRKKIVYATKSGYNFLGSTQDPVPSTGCAPAAQMNQLLAKIKDEKVNLGLTLAEYRKTAQSFVQAAQRLHEIYRAIKRLQLRPPAKPPRIPRRVANNVAHQLPRGSQQSRDYLLVRYGLMPTVQDMLGALDVLQDGAERPLVSRKTKNTNSTTLGAEKINQSVFPGETLKFESDCNSTLIAYIQWNPADISNQMNRLGLSNPLALAWELVPYSFVVDWFIDVGSTLGALDALNGAQRTSCTTTKRSKLRMVSSFSGSYFGRAYSRSVTALSPTLPHYKPSTSAIHIADAIALLTKSKL